MKPRYHPRCAYDCVDRMGKPREGSQWIHLDGHTAWVCDPCARQVFNAVQTDRPIPADRWVQETFSSAVVDWWPY